MKGKQGYSLVEVMAALGVLVIVVLSLLTLNTRSVYNAVFARDQALATKQAQQAMEMIRIRREQNSWNDFINNCEGNGSLGAYPTPPLPFSLAVDCFQPGSDPPLDCQETNDSCEIQVVASWADANGTHQSQLTTRLNNWR